MRALLPIYLDLIPVYDRVSFGPDLVNNNNMKHTCNVSKLQKYMYGHLLKCWVSHILSQTTQVQLVWLVYAWALCWVGLGWSQIQEVGFLMHMCLAHERKSFIWSKWYELSVKWVNLSHSNQGGGLLNARVPCTWPKVNVNDVWPQSAVRSISTASSLKLIKYRVKNIVS